MLMWDYQMQCRKHDIASLSQQQRLDIALACLTNVRIAAMQLLEDGHDHARRFVYAGERLIRNARVVGDIPVDAAERLLVETSLWLPLSSAGIRDVCMCIVIILQRAGELLTECDLYDIMSYAYQIVLHTEILSKVEHETTESEVRELEVSNAASIACIGLHLQLIIDALAGRTIRRE